MPLKSHAALIQGQFETLVQLFPEVVSGLNSFLAEPLQPLERESLRANARAFAEDLLFVPNEGEASMLLQRDRAKTQAFFVAYMAILPSLPLRASPSTKFSEEEAFALPFYFLADWILDDVNRD